MFEVLFCLVFIPARCFHQSIDELFFARNKVYHSAMSVTDKSNVLNTANSNSKRNFKLTVAQVGSSRPENERKIIRHMHMLAVVHAHTNKQPRSLVLFKFPVKIMILRQ